MRRPRLWTGVLACAGMATSMALAIPAHATPVRQLTRAEATSPATTANKAVTAGCPAGTRAYSTGASVDHPADGRVVIDKIETLKDRRGVMVSAKSLGTVTPWRVTAYAVCAQPVLSQRQADSVVQQGDTDSCPGGTRLTGLGGVISHSTGNEGLSALEPNVALTQASVNASGGTGPWTVAALAMCDNVDRLHLVQSTGPMGGSTVTVSCGGDRVLGAGGKVSGLPDWNHQLIAVEPNAALTGVTVTGISTDAPTVDGGAGRWNVTAYAICVPAR
jgi:hypothetical protein